jgi:beta-mannosidase
MFNKVFAVLLITILMSSSFSSAQTILLNSNWQFRQVNTKQWYKATVPGTVHTDLLSNNLIPPPYYGNSESKLQWINKANWEYQTTFSVTNLMLQQSDVQLVFEGLDTYCKVYLNNVEILNANNMFRTWKVQVSHLLKLKENHLKLVFTSAELIADSLAAASSIKLPCENNRNYVRKAQYHFGWDFAPKFITCGIWRKVQLLVPNQNITKTSIKRTIQGHNWSNKNVQLIQEKDSIGQSFYFTINGKPTFIKGANWVPADMFLPSITYSRYKKLLVAAKQAGMNMLRVWGGGIYEDEIFYNLCDSLGIMVWQDFMFAGAIYPTDSGFIENVKHEMIDNLKRLTKHPCIVLWCGNNEIDEAWHNWGWQKEYHLSNADSSKLWKAYQQLFHELLPSLVKQYSSKPYITTSPLYGWGRQQSITHGDSHYWGVWWGLQPIEKYQEKIPRFMSEYGMQALPNKESLQQFIPLQEMDTTSNSMRAHQKHPTGFQTLSIYLKQNNLTANTFEEYIGATQTLQANALSTAITAHLAAQPRCMGTMLWQLNDCWPGISWSIIDYYGNKKKAYESVRKLYNQQ